MGLITRDMGSRGVAPPQPWVCPTQRSTHVHRATLPTAMTDRVHLHPLCLMWQPLPIVISAASSPSPALPPPPPICTDPHQPVPPRIHRDDAAPLSVGRCPHSLAGLCTRTPAHRTWGPPGCIRRIRGAISCARLPRALAMRHVLLRGLDCSSSHGLSINVASSATHPHCPPSSRGHAPSDCHAHARAPAMRQCGCVGASASCPCVCAPVLRRVSAARALHGPRAMICHLSVCHRPLRGTLSWGVRPGSSRNSDLVVFTSNAAIHFCVCGGEGGGGLRCTSVPAPSALVHWVQEVCPHPPSLLWRPEMRP